MILGEITTGNNNQYLKYRMEKSKFYQDGLHFECTGCGECCRLPGGRVEITREEAGDIAIHLGISPDEFFSGYCENGEKGLELKDKNGHECIFLENDRCVVYEARPLQCRTFPFWPENLKSRHRWESLKTFCPGIDQGPLHTLQEIFHLRKVQRERDRKVREEK